MRTIPKGLNPDAAMDFTEFVAERHRIWELRQAGAPQPWTTHTALGSYKFTNVYRVLDPGSQFVLTDLAEPDAAPVDVLARLFLYRYTNWPATWHWMRDKLGRYPLARDLDETLVSIINGKPGQVFSGAYMIIPQPGFVGDKVQMAVELAQRALETGVLEEFLAADTQADRLAPLRSLYGVGDFLAMQILTDWGYTPHCGADREDEFAVFGPGSKRGARALGVGSIEEALDLLHAQPDCPRLALPHGRVRLPSLMDVQNCLCEFSKLVRYNGKPPSRRVYPPAHPGPQAPPVLPESW